MAECPCSQDSNRTFEIRALPEDTVFARISLLAGWQSAVIAGRDLPDSIEYLVILVRKEDLARGLPFQIFKHLLFSVN